MGMPYAGPSRFATVAWTLATGTPLDGYDVDKLSDLDPSNGLAIEEDVIDLRGDLGAATRIDAVTLFHPNFDEGVELRLQVHSDTATWGGTTDIDFTIVVPPWLGRFSRHLCFYVAGEKPTVSDRTRRYLRITNVDEYISPIKIGEIVVITQLDQLDLGVQPEVQRNLTYGRSKVEAKRGPEYIHDRRTRERRWTGSLNNDPADHAAFTALQDESYGVLAFVMWPENQITDEPVLARFSEATYQPTILQRNATDIYAQSSFGIRELSCGEAY